MVWTGDTELENGIILVKEGGEGYYEEKKSKFIAAVLPVSDESEAAAYIEAARKKYWDARHNCYAYVIGDNNELTRCSDDGEPSGTAGKPILEVITGRKIHNCLVIVTRYFGGTLLGTGGLVRAYQKASSDAFDNSLLVRRINGSRIIAATAYSYVGKLQYCAQKNGYRIDDIVYGADAQLTFSVPSELSRRLIEDITDITSGTAIITEERNTEIYVEL